MNSDQTLSISRGGRCFSVIAPKAGSPRLLFWGPSAAFEEHNEAEFPPLPSCADVRVERELFPVDGKGFHGEAALLAHGARSSVFEFNLTTHQTSDFSLALDYVDAANQLSLCLCFELDESGVLLSSAKLTNQSDNIIHLQRLNALSLPLPRWIDTVDLGYGGWSSEGHSARIPLIAGKIERTGRAGRPGFEGGPHLLLTQSSTTEQTGAAIGIALANSGNYTLAAERFGHGDAQVIASEWLQAGEIALASGDTYQTPTAISAISMEGVSELSAQFHAYARSTTPVTRTHRPVQLNTWEAVYFDIDEQSAILLTNEAAKIGVERFVLDDGWFKGRDNDGVALGDWIADPEKFPNGLTPLAEHVVNLGMEFGLWVEPEMVSPKSDLFQKHPDWILSADGTAGPTGRHQLVLNLDREDTRNHLYDVLDQLLTHTKISYLKWDCNRDLFPAATQKGPTTHRQIAGLYTLLDRLRRTHPKVAIESCASGGGRIDFGVIKRADRFWASDSTDPYERIGIQRRTSLFYPIEMLGAHVGSSPNHWTGRATPMVFRCLVALFGHFGVELNPASLNPYDTEVLKRAITIYKKHRDLLTSGKLIRFDSDEGGLDIQAVQHPNHEQMLLRILRMKEPTRRSLAPVRLQGLPAQTRWRVSEFKLEGPDTQTPLGSYSSAWLGFTGVDVAPAHAGQGRLFLMERSG